MFSSSKGDNNSSNLSRVILTGAALALSYCSLLILNQMRQYRALQNDLGSIPEATSPIEEQKHTLTTFHKPKKPHERILHKQMSAHSLNEIEDDQSYAFAFARKKGFYDWFGEKTPFIHSSLAFLEGDDHWLVVGRQSPYYREGETQMKFHETQPDNEIHYVLFGEKPEESAFHLEKSHVEFTGAEIKEVLARGKEKICSQTCDMLKSNCYSFSTYCLTQFIDTLDKREEKQPGHNDQRIKKLALILKDACNDQYAQGICNNDVVAQAIKQTVKILNDRGLTNTADLVAEAGLKAELEYLSW